jgi:F0F1-type ATP synthase delta subunit
MKKENTLVYNWNFSRDFPEITSDQIDRPNFLETIVEILNQETRIVFLEGEEGDGATTTLAQFCLKYPARSFSLFIKPASRFAYSPDYLRLALAEQLYWYVYGTAINKETLDISEFDTLVLRMRAKERHATLYFVIDGLHQIPTEDHRLVAQIFSEVLPLGVDNCRFIITGHQQLLAPFIKGKLKSKTYQQLKFHPEESRDFLSKTGLDDADCNAVHQMCKGIPGRLAAIKRLLIAGTSLPLILETDPSKYLEFIKLEFSSLDQMDEDQQLIIATIAFSKFSLSINDVSVLLSESEIKIQTTLQSSQFLTVNSVTNNIEFVSVSHQKFAEKQLETFRQKSLTAQLEHLLKNPKSTASLHFLPSYYEILSQQESILNLISKEHYSDLLESTQSFTALRNRADMGARNALSLKRTEDVFKFSLQKSIFISAGNLEASEFQIEALVAMGKSNAALTLANHAAANEDRLALLATYARRVKERTGNIDPELLTVIKTLTADLSFSELGDKAIKIAANILIFDPDVAIGIIESASKGATEGVKDAAYAELSITASVSKLKHSTKIEDKARPRISDAALQQVAHSFEALAEKLDVVELISILSKMPAAHQISFLRAFIKLRKADTNVLDLVEYGLGKIISESEYTPRISDLAELAAPFTNLIADVERLRRIVSRFDSQMGLVAKAAQSKDLTLLQMRLAAAEFQFLPQHARDRIEQTYFDVSEIRTPEVQLECYALMLGSLKHLDSDGKLEEKDGFRALVKADLAKVLEKILSNTGDHLASVSAVLKVLAADDPIAALEVAGKLNTENRRNKAHSLVANVIASQYFSDAQIQYLRSALSRVTCKNDRSMATVDLLGAFDASKERGSWLPHIEEFRSAILSPVDQGKWDVWVTKQKCKSNLPFSVNDFKSQICNIASKIESNLDIIDLYFKAAEAIGASNLDDAKHLYEKGLQHKSEAAFNTRASSHLLGLCLSLIGRSITPLAQAGMLDDDTLKRFDRLISELPSVLEKVRAYSDFAERLWCAKRQDLAYRVVQEQLRSLLEQTKLLDITAYQDAITVVFPIFSVWHLNTALEMLKDVCVEAYDSALHDAARLRLRKLPTSSPDMNGKSDHTKLESHDAVDVVQLIGCAQTDSSIFVILKALVEVVKHKGNNTKFTGQQKADWATKCREIINKKLPDPRNIQHFGFKVVCLALTYAIEDTTFNKWKDLENMAESIPNVADKGYVYLCLATSLPNKFTSHRKGYLDKALELAKQVPSPIDRLSHLHDYAQQAFSHDATASAKETLKHAMQLSLEIENNSRTARHRRDLIDLADQIDSGLADELIALVDDDPARVQLKMEAKRVAAISKAKRELANAKHIKDASVCDLEMLPAAAWKNLAALEAGRLEIKPLDVMTEYVSRATHSSLHDAYPVLSWHLANLERKFRQQKDIATHISPVSEALLLSTEIAHAVICQITQRKVAIEEESDSGIVVGRQSREDAVSYIEAWVLAHASDYIKYCDAYFSPKDIALLRLFLAQAPSCKVFILASKKTLQDNNALSDDVFKDAWRALSEQSPPETEVIALSYADSTKHVVHDRWLLTNGGGLRLGTSFNSLGEGKLSEVSEIEPIRAAAIERQMDLYISRQRIVDGARIQYNSFTLD